MITQCDSRVESTRSAATNLIDHEYRGGQGIAALRGLPASSDAQPEEWLGSTTGRQDDQVSGLSRLLDGSTLQQLVAADHEAWVGRYAAQTAGPSDTGILFKLLDAGQRLPVHVHPDRAFARRHFDCPYGKTEAWLILETGEDCAVYLGWKEEVSLAELADRRDAQDSDWMLAHLNRIEVRPGISGEHQTGFTEGRPLFGTHPRRPLHPPELHPRDALRLALRHAQRDEHPHRG